MEAGSIMCKVSASGTTIVQGRAGQSGETLPRRATKGYASGSGGGTDRQWPRPVVGSRPVSGVVTVLYLLGGSLHEVDDLLVGSICPRPLCGVLGCIPSDPTPIVLDVDRVSVGGTLSLGRHGFSNLASDDRAGFG